MPQIDPGLSTGLKGLDRVLKGLIPGDNIVFHVDTIEQYADFSTPFVEQAARREEKVVYFRFASHPPLLEPREGVEMRHLRPEEGFEPFITEIHRVIKKLGRGGCYLFDCLTDLAAEWYSDQMLGNLFMLTCPRLYDVAAIAYFSVLRNRHSQYALSAITDTTQIFIDVLEHRERLYIQPVKVQQRYSPSMYTIHAREEGAFIPVKQSAMISEIRRSSVWQGLDSSGEHLNVWNRTFREAEDTYAAICRGELPPETGTPYFKKLLRMVVSRHEKILSLAERYLALPDLIEIGRRTVGTGLIGGKSVGMLLARAILEKTDHRWRELMEPHDSFYIGSDVFYTFLVTNGIWWVRQQKDLNMLLEGAITARQRMLVGRFSEHITRQLSDLLDYYGQSPIIVRSSSLLEDNFGNAFAGKYESVFCVNQGPRYKRLEDLMTAVRAIYASAMSEEAIKYRARRGMLDRDEQMSLLVQRVSGSMHNHLFYPHAAGVGLSFNPYAWNEHIDPAAGVLRMVFGMGTRAVDYVDGDYTRVVALNDPVRRPEGGSADVREHSQKKADVLDLESNQLVGMAFRDVAEQSDDLPLDLLASRDRELADLSKRAGSGAGFPYVLTFDTLLKNTGFVGDMREALTGLREAYDYPVDIEFTLNFLSDDDYRINILQCRPFQCPGGGSVPPLPADLKREDIILASSGAVIGQGREIAIDRFIYVVPREYGNLPVNDRYAVARLIGRLSRACADGGKTVMLLGPGRWGTSSPSLGVPINFSEISTVSVLCEIVAMRDGLVPDVSLGTHIFNEMVEMEMLYLALFPGRENNFLNADLLEGAPNLLPELVTDESVPPGTVRVIDAAAPGDGAPVLLNADTMSQKVVCYRGAP